MQQSLNADGLGQQQFWDEINGVLGTTPQPTLPPPMAMIDPHHNIRNATEIQIFPHSSQPPPGHPNDSVLINMGIGGPDIGYQSRDMSPCTPPYGVSAYC